MCLGTGPDAGFFGYGLVFVGLVFVFGNFGPGVRVCALVEGLKGYQFRVFTDFSYWYLELDVDGSGVVAIAVVACPGRFGVKGVRDGGYAYAVAITIYEFAFDDVVLSAFKILEGYLVGEGDRVGIGFTRGIDCFSAISTLSIRRRSPPL